MTEPNQIEPSLFHEFITKITTDPLWTPVIAGVLVALISQLIVFVFRLGREKGRRNSRLKAITEELTAHSGEIMNIFYNTCVEITNEQEKTLVDINSKNKPITLSDKINKQLAKHLKPEDPLPLNSDSYKTPQPEIMLTYLLANINNLDQFSTKHREILIKIIQSQNILNSCIMQYNSLLATTRLDTYTNPSVEVKKNTLDKYTQARTKGDQCSKISLLLLEDISRFLNL